MRRRSRWRWARRRSHRPPWPRSPSRRTCADLSNKTKEELVKEFGLEIENPSLREAFNEVIYYCLANPDDLCDSIMMQYSKQCTEILHPLCRDENFSHYLIRENLVNYALTEYYSP